MTVFLCCITCLVDIQLSTITFTFSGHIDGNHKLIRWRFVIHGGIDGFSRAVVFLHCSTNNEARPVLHHFHTAIQRFRCPLRIRTDHGTENIMVARWMLERFGSNTFPVLTGLSVHNQRIERLWVDVYTYVSEHFINLFHYIESINLLSPDCEIHLYALHHVFQPRINNCLSRFSSQWNNHPLRTEGNASPLQLWTRGFYQYATNDGSIVRDLLDRTFAGDYGIDEDGPFPDLQTNNHVEIPRSSIELRHDEEAELQARFTDVLTDNNYGIDVYSHVVDFLSHITQ